MNDPRQPWLTTKPGAWNELALTLPVFLAYQLGVVFLDVRNATDLVTERLLELSHGDKIVYLELTGGVGLATLLAFGLLGRGQGLRLGKLLQTCLEGATYATAMGAASSWIVGKLFAGIHAPAVASPVTGLVMSLGAGFYEELAFRVVLFGLGAKILVWAFARQRVAFVADGPAPTASAAGIMILWAILSASAFSAMHYAGALGDPFDLRSFVARAVLGLALTVVYATRGFAAAVWTHALYDIWVLVF
jgi:hypothetical protein